MVSRLWSLLGGSALRVALAAPVFRSFVGPSRSGFLCCRAFMSSPHRPGASGVWLSAHQPPQGEVQQPFQTVAPTLDKEAFREKRLQPALRVPANKCHEVISRLAPHLFRSRRVKCVVLPEDSGGLLQEGERLVLCQRPEGDTGAHPLSLPPEVQAFVQETNTPVLEFCVELSYDDLSMDQVLRRLLPSGVEAPSSFESVGHVAHLNLRPQALPYKQLVAQVLLDKNPRIRTVVNKLDAIASKFRTFPLEVIGGDPCLDVDLKEGPARFKFNFAEVYWNSRLQTEHTRITNLIPPGAVVCDVFAGVGPFAVPLAMKGCHVYANDLNGRSYHFLQHNARLNKVSDRIVASNLDGRAFIERMDVDRVPVQHLIMNLPHSALEFLDALRGRFAYVRDPPMVHVYCFSKAHDPTQDAIQRASCALGRDLSVVGGVRVHHVRDVAPHKPMLCLSFPLWTPKSE